MVDDKKLAKGPSEFVNEAYQLSNKADMVDFYQKWADDYDHQMIDELGYVSPMKIAQLLMEYLSDQHSSIFDIGCGTGLTCKLLHESGYRNLDGIDMSPDMIKVAGQRGLYRELLVGDVNLPLDRIDASYDGVISSGTFTHGHVGPEPLDEIFRILKPGGILACTVHFELWETLGFRQKLENLVEQNVASCVYQQQDKYYQSGEVEGWFCLYQKNN